MVDQKTDRSKTASDCFVGMPEMMVNMMSKKGASCGGPCAEKMAEMMPECCLVHAQEESPAEKPGQDAPK